MAFVDIENNSLNKTPMLPGPFCAESFKLILYRFRVSSDDDCQFTIIVYGGNIMDFIISSAVCRYKFICFFLRKPKLNCVVAFVIFSFDDIPGGC